MRTSALPLLALLVGCGGAPSARDTVFAPVPADTPLLLVMEPPPDGYFERRLGRARGEVDAVLDLLIDLEVPDGESEPELRWFSAVARRFRGRLTEAGLRELGLRQSGHSVVYADRSALVVRWQLDSGARFVETVRQVAKDARGEAPERAWQGRVWWDLSPPSSKVGALAAVDGDVLVLAMLLGETPRAALPRLLGVVPPDVPLSSTDRVADLRERYGFTWFFGTVESGRLMELLLSSLVDEADLTVECGEELRRLLAAIPALHFGAVESPDPEVDQTRTVIPLSAPARAELAQIVGAPPGLGETIDPELGFVAGVGLRVGALLDWLRRKGAAIRQSPYACEQLSPLNDFAEQLEARLAPATATPIPGLWGVTVALSRLDVGEGIEAIKVGGLLLLGTTDPAEVLGLLGLFSMFSDGTPGAPPFRVDSVPPEGKLAPLQLPPMVSQIFGQVGVARGPSMVGVAAGADNAERLSAAVRLAPQGDDTFARFAYDPGFFSALGAAVDDDADADEAIMKALERLQTTIMSMYARSRGTWRMTSEGVEASVRQRLKP